MLKIFVDKSYINRTVGHLPMLYPWWGNCDNSQLDRGRFDNWTKEGRNFFSVVPIENCDIVLLPSEWRANYKAAHELALKARKYHKKVLIFFNSDSDEDIPIENAIIFRTSLYKSPRKPNEFAMPAWSVDFSKIHMNGSMILREKNEVPSIGYSGYIDYHNTWEWIKYTTRYVRRPRLNQIALYLRGNIIRQLFKSPNIKTNFILRSKCLTGTINAMARKEHVKCIVDSDYSLVVRGGGNFSYRLYEILSCGRIPLFVNTDCVLPFEQFIDWKKACLWIEQTQIKSISDIVSNFHTSISNEQFKAMQTQARSIYEQWICPTGFYSNIWRYIINDRN